MPKEVRIRQPARRGSKGLAVLRTASHLDGKLGGYGSYFNREWCTVVDEVPADLDVVRYWDLAAIPIGRSASSSAVTGTAAIGCSIWRAGRPTRVMSIDYCSIPRHRMASRSASALARIRDRPARARRCTGARAQWLYRNAGKPTSHARQRDRSTASLRFTTAGVTRSSLCSVPPGFSTEDFVTHCLAFRA